jgi:hypothetical protein
MLSFFRHTCGAPGAPQVVTPVPLVLVCGCQYGAGMADNSEADAEIFLSPGDAAHRLGLSPSGLRRLAGVWAQLYGDLPKGSSGNTRLWPQEAVVRLQQARLLVATGQARTIKDGLLAIERGAQSPPAGAVVSLGHDARIVEALEVVSAQLTAIREGNAALRHEVAQLRGELAELRAVQSQLVAPAQPLPEALLGSEWSAEQPEAPESAEGQPAPDVQAQRQPEAPDRALSADQSQPGVLIRAAQRLEALLSRFVRG